MFELMEKGSVCDGFLIYPMACLNPCLKNIISQVRLLTSETFGWYEQFKANGTYHVKDWVELESVHTGIAKETQVVVYAFQL